MAAFEELNLISFCSLQANGVDAGKGEIMECSSCRHGSHGSRLTQKYCQSLVDAASLACQEGDAWSSSAPRFYVRGCWC